MVNFFLPNPVVFAIFLTGADQFTNLAYSNQSLENETKCKLRNNIFSSELQAKVLAIFYRDLSFLEAYPCADLIPSLKIGLESPKSTYGSRYLTNEMLQSLPTFIFPNGFHVLHPSSHLAPIFSCTVLTNIDGDRFYIASATVWRKFYIDKQQSIENDKIKLYTSFEIDSHNYSYEYLAKAYNEIYIPLACSLVSKSPSFQSLKDILSSIIFDIEKAKDIYLLLFNLMKHISIIPTPPVGILMLTCELNSNQILFQSISNDYPFFGSNLYWPFQSLSTRNILCIICYILTQQNILFLSKNLSLLTLTTSCFMSYIYPFEWRMTYAPILPKQLLGVLEAPTSFICGTHSQNISESEYIDYNYLIFVNLDEGTIKYSKEMKLEGLSFCMPLPNFLKHTDRLQQLFNKRNLPYFQLNRATHGELFQHKIEESLFYKLMDNYLTDLIIQFLLDLFENVADYVKFPSVFDKEGYLGSISTEYKSFYETVVSTDIFSQIVKHLLQKRKTIFSKSLEKRKNNEGTFGELEGTLRLKDIDSMSSFVFISPSKSDDYYEFETNYVSSELLKANAHNSFEQILIDISSDGSSSYPILALPSFPNDLSKLEYVQNYYKSCLNSISQQLNTTNSGRGELIYLRGNYHLALGDILNAMEDFFSILPKISINLVPKKTFFADIFQNLSNDDRNTLKSTPYFQRDMFQFEDNETSFSRKMSYVKVPTCSLARDDFELYLQGRGIPVNGDTSTILFALLTSNGNLIHPQTLKSFSEAWIAISKVNHDIFKSLASLNNQSESIIYCSPDDSEFYIKTNITQGRAILTDHNFYLLDSDNRLNCVIFFQNNYTLIDFETKENIFQTHPKSFGIKAIQANEMDNKKCKHTNILRSSINSHPSIVNIKFSTRAIRDFFLEALREMRAAHSLMIALKDESYLKEASLNIKLLGSLFSFPNKHNENYDSSDSLIFRAINNSLCNLQKENIKLISFTNDGLMFRFNPLQTDTQKASIEVLLSITEKSSTDVMFWIGYVFKGQSIICIYSLAKRGIISDFILQDQRVESIAVVGEKVWISTLNKSLYIIDKYNHTIDSTLFEPSDVAMSIHYQALENEIWVLYNKGTIVVWDYKTLESKKTFQLGVDNGNDRATRYSSMLIYHTMLWIVVNKDLKVYDKDLGIPVAVFPLLDSNSKHCEAKLICLSSNNEIWIAASRDPIIFIYDPLNLTLITLIEIGDLSVNSGFNSILKVENTIWIGGKNGHIFVFDVDTRSYIKSIKAHDDSIRSLAYDKTNSIVASGSTSLDGRISFWHTKVINKIV